MRRETPLLLVLVAVLAVVAGTPTGSASVGVSPTATHPSRGGFTLLAAIIAVVVATRYRALWQ
jgi:hypothetical protein